MTRDPWEATQPRTTGVQRKWAARAGLVVLLLGVAGLVAWGAMSFMKGGKGSKRQVVPIALLKPPPPPPPPPPEQRIPEPETPKEEVKLPEPEPEPQPAQDDAPPPGEQLGLDADGSGGSDGFGLAARKGGRDITDGIGGGGSGNRSQFAWFSGQVQSFLQDQFQKNEKLRSADYRVVVRLWFGSDGRLERYELVNGSGSGEIDQNLKSAMAELPRMKVAIPADLPQPLRIRVTSRGAS